MVSRRSSTPTREPSSPARPSLGSWNSMGSESAWMARGGIRSKRIKGGGGTEEEFPDDVPHVIPGLDGQQGTQVSGFPRPPDPLGQIQPVHHPCFTFVPPQG